MRAPLLSRLPAVAFFLWLAGAAHAADLPLAADLQADARAARSQRLPLVLFFSSETCAYCREVAELYLGPMARDNAAHPRFIVRTVEVDESRPMRDFAGRATDMRAFARVQGVTLVPHLRFLGPDGQPLAPDLRGLSSRDFYYGYLEDSINTAGEKLRR